MTASTAPFAKRAAWARVNHPAFVLAIAVLVANDMLLKEVWPGLVTGKLSDAAGLFLLAALGFDALDRLGASARWRWVLAAAMAAPFVAVKTHAAATTVARDASAALLDLVGPVFGWLPGFPSDGAWAQIVTDPTDILMLPALALPLFALASRSYRRGARNEGLATARRGGAVAHGRYRRTGDGDREAALTDRHRTDR